MAGANETTRTESDTMGEVSIPGWAYWGAQTQRAVENFSVSDRRIPAPFLRALALVKRSAAEANEKLGTVPGELAGPIAKAAGEVMDGTWDDHFPIDVFQTGSGTSWNMNMNEVIANRANELLGQPLGTKKPVHPNDHVNRGQSSNDVVPTAIHVATRLEAAHLAEALDALAADFQAKSDQFADVIKIGRTHLQDAVPMTLGQEFSGYATQVRKSAERVRSSLPHLEELALGGTAVGTGINTHPEFATEAVGRIAKATGVGFRPADNYFEAIGSKDALAGLSGSLQSLAGSLMKIGQDLRLLAGGPRAGFGEVKLPSLQPGSSIMPGKVNPVIPEMVIQVAARIMGMSTTVSVASQTGPLELNIMMPLLASELIEGISLLTNTVRAFGERCVRGIEADEERCRYWVEWSLALVTPLATRIGYDKAAEIAYQAYRERRTVLDIARERHVLGAEELEQVLDPRSMLNE